MRLTQQVQPVGVATFSPRPRISRNRALLALIIAASADALDVPLAVAEFGSIGTAFIPAEVATLVMDGLVMGIMIKLLGYHWAFLPTFMAEAIPGLDLCPTWVASVSYVLIQRKRDNS